VRQAYLSTAMLEKKWLYFLKIFFGKQIKLRGYMRGGILQDMGAKVLVSVAIAAVVGL
jgi:hypothetical protein